MAPSSATLSIALLLLRIASQGIGVRAWDPVSPLWATTEFTGAIDSKDLKSEYRQSPCSDHEFYLTKDGVFTARTNTVGQTGFTFAYPDSAIFTWADHGALGMELHPDFPAQPYVFILYVMEATPPWGDDCKIEIDGGRFCESHGRLVRFKLDVTVNAAGVCTNIGFQQAVNNPYILLEDFCTTSNAHGIGDIDFYDGDLLLTSGDHSQPNGPDHGLTYDTCYVPSKGMPQGRFRSQRMDFINGKVIRFYGASLLMTTGRLQYGTDFHFVAIGLRQPYSMTVDKTTGQVFIGDVGSNIKEEINQLTRADLMRARTAPPLNFGWPCIEGTAYLSESGAALDKEWIQTQCNPSTMDCSLCATIYPCATNAPGVGGCSALYRPPAFEYRGVTLDPKYPDECQRASSAIVGLTVFKGTAPQFGATGSSFMPSNLVAMDYGTGCMWYFKNNADGTPDFPSGAHLLLKNHFGGMLRTARDGYVYSALTISPYTMFRHGIATNDDPPAAKLVLRVRGPSGAYTTCTGLCQVGLGSTVQLDASSSVAGGSAISTFTFDFGDGTPALTQVAALPAASHLYGTSDLVYVSVVVADAAGKSGKATAPLLVGISVGLTMTPASGLWKLGDTISYALQLPPALAASSVAADAYVSHCYPNLCTGVDDCHTHPNGVDKGSENRAAGTLTPQPHDMPSNMVLSFTVSPPSGAAFQATFTTQCLEYQATLRSAVVGGAEQAWPVNSGEIGYCSTPCSRSYMALNGAALSANRFQADYLGNIFKISSWSVNTPGSGSTTIGVGASSISLPVTVGGMTMTANYVAAGAAASAGGVPPSVVAVSGKYKSIELVWELPSPRTWDWVVVSVRSAAAPFKDYSTTYPAEGPTTVLVTVPAGAATYFIALAGYSSVSNTRTAWGDSYSVASSADSAQQLCTYTPYGPYPVAGTAGRLAVPGVVESEYYGVGGNGVAYYAATPGNNEDHGSIVRNTDDMDIKAARKPPGFGQIVLHDAEWAAYPVAALATGAYSVTVSLLLKGGEGSIKTMLVMLDRADCVASAAAASVTFPLSQKLEVDFDVTLRGLYMTAGDHTIRICTFLKNGYFYIDRMTFATSAFASPAPTSMVTKLPTTAPTPLTSAAPTLKPSPGSSSMAPTLPPSVNTITAAPSMISAAPTLTPSLGLAPTLPPSINTVTAAPSNLRTGPPTLSPTAQPAAAQPVTPQPVAACDLCPISLGDLAIGLGATLTPGTCASPDNIGCNFGGVAACRLCVWDTTKADAFPYKLCPPCAYATYCSTQQLPASECPAAVPTPAPTTTAATAPPTAKATLPPTATPTQQPTATAGATGQPTTAKAPTAQPSFKKTAKPAVTQVPTGQPSFKTTAKPSSKTTAQPSPAPTAQSTDACALCPISPGDLAIGLGASLTPDTCATPDNIGCNFGGTPACRLCVWDTTKADAFPYKSCPPCAKQTYCSTMQIPVSKC